MTSPRLHIVFFFLVFFLGNTTTLVSAVLSGEERALVLSRGEAIVSMEIRSIDPSLIKEIGNPFTAPLIPEPVVEKNKVEAPESASEVLATLSNRIKPTGVFSLGGSFILMFKETRKRVGDVMNVPYGDKEYNLVISDIQGTSYTLKYKDAELQIKLN